MNGTRCQSRISTSIRLRGEVSQIDPAEERTKAQDGSDEFFPPIGEFQPKGTLITLPYCWHTAIDTRNNPSLCAVETYDISGDQEQFAGIRFNRPDLLPIVRSIEYAQAHDYPAALAYCGSAEIAARIVRDMPPYLTGGVISLKISRLNPSRKRIELGENPTFRFEVENRGDRWLVVAFDRAP